MSRRDCKHRCFTEWHWNGAAWIHTYFTWAACASRRCITCGAWLSLGQANDDDERVRVEIRAAEIAVTWLELRKSQLSSELREICDGAEIAGWIEHLFDSAKVPDQDGEWSGWLAREIHEHDKRPGCQRPAP